MIADFTQDQMTVLGAVATVVATAAAAAVATFITVYLAKKGLKRSSWSALAAFVIVTVGGLGVSIFIVPTLRPAPPLDSSSESPTASPPGTSSPTSSPSPPPNSAAPTATGSSEAEQADPAQTPAAPALRADPDTASPGDTITVYGTGFDSGERVRVSWEGEHVMEQLLRDTTADEDGNFTVEVVVIEHPYEEPRTRHTDWVNAEGMSSGITLDALVVVTT